jgi:cysteinyl-tRNA synthetase
LLLLEEEGFRPETIRFFLLSTHYRRPIDFSVERIREVEKGMDTFYRFFKRYERITGESFYDLAAPATREEGDFDPGDDPLLKTAAGHRDRFLEAMDDDFNTAGGVAALFDLVRELNKYADQEGLEQPAKRDPAKLASLKRATVVFKELAGTLGLFRRPPEEAAPTGDNELTARLLDLLVEIRAEARKARDFATADKIRDSLAEIGVALEDRPGGTEWSLH